MAPYPDEDLPIMSLSLQEFNELARNLLVHSMEDGGDPLHHRFTNFVLAGRYVTAAGIEHRVHIDPTKNVVPTEQIDDLVVTRDYDSLIGICQELPFRCALSMFPISNFRDALRISNHIKWRVTSPVRRRIECWMVFLTTGHLTLD